MLPIIGRNEEKRLDLVMSYLQSQGDPSIRFVDEFFRQYEIKQTEFIEYLKRLGPDMVKYQLRQNNLLRDK